MAKIIYNDFIPFRGFYACNIFGVVFIRKGTRSQPYNHEVAMNHEAIHTAQMRELGYILFYVLYFLEWLVWLVAERDSVRAYRRISFEREAYVNERDFRYLNDRKRYSAIKYFGK